MEALSKSSGWTWRASWIGACLVAPALVSCSSVEDLPASAALCHPGAPQWPSGGTRHSVLDAGVPVADYSLQASDRTQRDDGIYWVRISGAAFLKERAGRTPLLYDGSGAYLEFDGRRLAAAGPPQLGRDYAAGLAISFPVDLDPQSLNALAQGRGLNLQGSGSPAAVFVPFRFPVPRQGDEAALKRGWTFAPGTVTVAGQTLPVPSTPSCFEPARTVVRNYFHPG